MIGREGKRGLSPFPPLGYSENTSITASAMSR